MGFLQKFILLSFIRSLVSAITLLPAVVSSSQGNMEVRGNYFSSSKESNIKMNPRLVSEITLHGFLLSASMGFLMPVGILAIRMSNNGEANHRRLRIIFYVHAILQVEVERMRSGAHDKLMNKLAAVRHKAEEKRAIAEAKRNCQAAKIEEQAEYIRRTGRVPSSYLSFSCCNWCS